MRCCDRSHLARWNSDSVLLSHGEFDGQNLEKWFEQRERKIITQEQAIDWLKQLLEIVEYFHQRNYIHRDIDTSTSS